MSYVTGVCNFCGTGCGHLLNVSDGKVGGVFVSQNHPVSQGRLCVRGWHIHELLRTDDRITEPLVKKNGAFQKASTDEAISLVVSTLKKAAVPAEEIAFLGSPRSSNEDNYLFQKLARAVFGSNNVSLDSESGHRASLAVLHRGTGMAGMLGSLEDIAKARFILVVGTDITKQNPIIGSEIHKAARAGARLVTISSRTSQIAKLSGVHLRNRPGSTKTLLAAMSKSIIEENRYGKDFVQRFTEGFEGFANSLGSLNEADIPALTGIDFSTMKSVARELAEAETAMVFFSSGISGLDEDTISHIYNLFLVAGKVGREGCGVNPVAGICNLQGGYDMGVAPDLLPGYQAVGDTSVRERFASAWGASLNAAPGKDVHDLLKDKHSKLKCLVVVDHDDGIIHHADRIGKLDFVVYIGAFKNKFMDFAHVVIPTASYIESDGTFTNTDRRIQLSRKKTEPAAGIMPAWKLYAAMAEKAGAAWRYNGPADVMKEAASLTPNYARIAHDKLPLIGGIQWPADERNPGGTKRYTLTAGGARARFVAVQGDFIAPKADERYPFSLVPGTAMHFWHQNNLMRRTFIPMREYNATLLLYPRGYVEICADDAKKIGVRDKWPVKVSSPWGSMNVAVRVSDEVRPGAAYIPYFIQEMIPDFLVAHEDILDKGEEAIIPVSIEKV